MPICAIHLVSVHAFLHQMKNLSELGQTEFDALLDLFSDDRHEAGVRYERLRRGLLRYFIFKGRPDPPRLVDLTIDRLAAKSGQFDREKSTTLEQYAYGFARRVAQEDGRLSAREVPLTGDEGQAEGVVQAVEGLDARCLRKCLNELDPADRKLLLDYHSVGGGHEKSFLRQKMFEDLNLTATAFYAKMSRLRGKLRNCIEECKRFEM